MSKKICLIWQKDNSWLIMPIWNSFRGEKNKQRKINLALVQYHFSSLMYKKNQKKNLISYSFQKICLKKNKILTIYNTDN
jgi:hypothetical protein